MKIVVCVKQVPEITDVSVNPETGTLIREGVTSILNPFCEYALDHAARLNSAHSETEVIAITMGPPQAKSALYRCLELGADRAVLVSDRKFAGADTWATALTLSAAIRQAVPDFNLILLGKQAIDGDNSQTAQMLAALWDRPQATFASTMTLTGNTATVVREVDAGLETIEVDVDPLAVADAAHAGVCRRALVIVVAGCAVFHRRRHAGVRRRITDPHDTRLVEL